MAIRIASDLMRKWRTNIGNLLVQAQDTSDVARATAGFERAVAAVQALHADPSTVPGLSPEDPAGPKMTDVFATPGGPCMMIDPGEFPPDRFDEILAILSRELERAGVDDALLAPPAADHLSDRLMKAGPAVVAWIFPPVSDQPGKVPARVPTAWLPPLAAWITDAARGRLPVRGGVVSVGFDLDDAGALNLLRSCRAARQILCRIASGDPTAEVRTLNANFEERTDLVPAVALSTGGSGCSENDLLPLINEVAGLIAQLSPRPAYAFAALDATFFNEGGVWPNSADWLVEQQLDGMYVASVCDEFVVDAYPWQLLSAGHVRRLDRQTRKEVQPLDPDHAVLWLGELASWLPSAPTREAVRHESRKRLEACLPREEDVYSARVRYVTNRKP